MRTIRLSGGRGTLRGDIVHMNPNFVIVVDETGADRKIPWRLIADISPAN